MNPGLKYTKLPTFLVAVLSCILFLPVLPFGLAILGLWLWFGGSTTNKQFFIMQNTSLFVITLGIVAFHFVLIKPYFHQLVPLNLGLARSFHHPAVFWLQMKSLLLNFGLIWVIPL